MKKLSSAANLVKRNLTWMTLGAFGLSACGRLETIPYDPPYTPAQWLTIQPNFQLAAGANPQYFMQPSTSAIVYLLGVITIAIGIYFLRIRQAQQARMWWGIGLLLWGLGAILAGTSYEAFSYAIKCAGREVCLWTSWWEVLYLLVTVWSIDAITMAVAYTSTTGRVRQVLMGYAFLNALVYLGVLLAGTFMPVKFWISFEMLILFAGPNILIFFCVNGWRAIKTRSSFDKAMVATWVWLGITIGAYFGYYLSGLTMVLWEKGIWFSENDVLHIFLIIWMLFIYRVVARQVQDMPSAV